MLSTIPSRRHSSAIAYSPRRPDNTIRIFSSAEYRLRVARRISRTCCSAVSDGTDFCLIFAPSRATMSQKSSLRKIPQSVSQLLTGNRQFLARLCPPGRDEAPAYRPKLKLFAVAWDQHVDRRGRGDVVARLQVHGRLCQPVEGDQLAPGVGLGEAAAHFNDAPGGP